MDKTIYIVVGDFYHEHIAIADCIRAAVASVGNELKISVGEFSGLKEALQQKPALLIVGTSDHINPQDEHVMTRLTDEIDTVITEYVKEGGSVLAMHAGMASYDPKSGYIKMLRGYFERHPEVNQSVHYYSVDTEKPGIHCDFSVLDEHYFVTCDEDSTHIFLRSESIDGHSPAGWRHTYGDGRVLCLTPTHRHEGLTHPDMIKLLGECVKWCLDE